MSNLTEGNEIPTGTRVTRAEPNVVFIGEVIDDAINRNDLLAVEFVKNYFRVEFEAQVKLLRLARVDVPEDAWHQLTGTFTVNIHRTYDWGNAGLTSPRGGRGFGNAGADDLIDVSWDLEMDLTGRRDIIGHELRHLLSFHALEQFWGDTGHGTPNDPIIRYVKDAWLKPVYHGDVQAIHARDFNKGIINPL